VSGSGTSATITSTGNGSATITATSGAASATLAVDVAQKFVTLTVVGPTAAMAIGANAQVQAVARDARNAPIAGASGAAFVTNDRTKVIVDNTGTITAIAPGATTVGASLTRDGVTASGTASVSVSAPVAGTSSATVQATTSNTFTPPSVNLNVGGTVAYAFGTVDHNVIFSGAGAPSDVPVSVNTTISRTFANIGTFNYTCTLHAGMNGTVIVSAASIFAQMNGANERPTANNSTANGAAVFTRSGGTVNYTVAFQGIASAPTGLHIHAPGNATQVAGILVDLMPTPYPNSSGVVTGSFTAANIRPIGSASPISLDSLFVLLTTSNAYVNVHSQTFLSGEIRGQTTQP
jgi:plastocyanin